MNAWYHSYENHLCQPATWLLLQEVEIIMCTHMKRAFGIRMTEGGVSLILYTFTKNDWEKQLTNISQLHNTVQKFMTTLISSYFASENQELAWKSSVKSKNSLYNSNLVHTYWWSELNRISNLISSLHKTCCHWFLVQSLCSFGYLSHAELKM